MSLIMSTYSPAASMILAFLDMGHSKKKKNKNKKVGFSRQSELRSDKTGPARVNAHALHAMWKLWQDNVDSSVRVVQIFKEESKKDEDSMNEMGNMAE